LMAGSLVDKPGEKVSWMCEGILWHTL
jgi:hypothetical protein